MNDIRPPRRPLNSTRPSQMPQRQPADSSGVSGRSGQSHPQLAELPAVQPMATAPRQASQAQTASDTTSSAQTPPVTPNSDQPSTGWSRRKCWAVAVFILAVALLLSLAGAYAWYRHQLTAVNNSDQAEVVTVAIPSGSTPGQISNILDEKSLIRSPLAFDIYTRIHGVRNQLLAGSYRISAAESTPEIVRHLTTGRVDEMTVTFYPGSALSSSAPMDNTPSHKKVLEDLGYSRAEIDQAFNADYDHPLLASKPDSADVEGYIFGETYQVAAGASVEQILERSFDEFYADLQSSGVWSKAQANDMSFHEIITLASIIQRESGGDDKAQIAQVFLSRMDEGMNLGSDVTYQYIADKQGIDRDVNLDSPYNTRRYSGLPPGPISSPTIESVQAVVEPAEGDYLYFLSGDDDVTYYARTQEEHEKNIEQHCEVKCTIL